MKNDNVFKTARNLTKRAKRIERALKFWCALSRVTRCGLHGFVLMMIRRTIMKAQVNNRRAEQVNRELRRVRAINRSR